MTSASVSPVLHAAVVPTPKLEEDFYDWNARHEAKVREAADSNHDLVFIVLVSKSSGVVATSPAP